MTRIEAAGIINAIKCSMVTTLKEHEALTMAECVLFEAEPKHGRWIKGEFDFLICSECGNTAEYLPILGQIETPYCSECGAKMDLTE